MPKRLRIIIFVVGVLILCCACLALIYAFWPLNAQELQSTLAPTLFTPP